MEQITNAYHILFTVVLIGLGLLLAVAFVRSVRGPEISDRILAINMIGSLVAAIIALLGAFLGEAWLMDITLIYVLISFLAVAILATVYIRKKGGKKTDDR